MPGAILPFRIVVPEQVIADLRQRLRATRWPHAERVGDWIQGVPLPGSRISAGTGMQVRTGHAIRQGGHGVLRG